MYFNIYSLLITVVGGALMAVMWLVATSEIPWARNLNVFEGSSLGGTPQAAPGQQLRRAGWPVFWALFAFIAGAFVRSFIYWALLMLVATAGAVFVAKSVIEPVYLRNGGNPKDSSTIIPLLVGVGFFGGWAARGGIGWILTTVTVIGAGAVALLIGRPQPSNNPQT